MNFNWYFSVNKKYNFQTFLLFIISILNFFWSPSFVIPLFIDLWQMIWFCRFWKMCTFWWNKIVVLIFPSLWCKKMMLTCFELHYKKFFQINCLAIFIFSFFFKTINLKCSSTISYSFFLLSIWTSYISIKTQVNAITNMRTSYKLNILEILLMKVKYLIFDLCIFLSFS